MLKTLIKRLVLAAVRTLITNTPLAPLAWLGPDVIRQVKARFHWLLRRGRSAG